MRSITWALLLAFTLQSFITQTHIHRAFDGSGRATIGKTLADGPSHTKVPQDISDCPFCQAIIHVGVFSTPSTLDLLLPITWTEIAAVPLVADAAHSPSSYRWHSRAPPRH